MDRPGPPRPLQTNHHKRACQISLRSQCKGWSQTISKGIREGHHSTQHRYLSSFSVRHCSHRSRRGFCHNAILYTSIHTEDTERRNRPNTFSAITNNFGDRERTASLYEKVARPNGQEGYRVLPRSSAQGILELSVGGRTRAESVLQDARDWCIRGEENQEESCFCCRQSYLVVGTTAQLFQSQARATVEKR